MSATKPTFTHHRHCEVQNRPLAGAAFGWYAQGFQERSGIAVTLDMPNELERLPIETETAVFRIVQAA
ncbi:MAG TPA: hypothetical protein VEK79_09420 [Thermoanaerobaculia bacterium]|nr:hypothetical protein [Thermoanaerobaculia bacterium]